MALKQGLPTLIEKPTATTAADARALVAAAERHGAAIVLPYGWNFKPIVETGPSAGRPKAGSARSGTSPRKWLRRWPICSAASRWLETRDHLFRPPVSTWADPARAGGYGWGQLTHGLGALFRIVDLDPVAVFAKTGLSPAGVDFYDAAVVEFANGATMALSGAATVPKSRGYQIDIRIFGSDGMLLFDIERARVEAVRHDGKSHVADLGAEAGAYELVAPITLLVELSRGAAAKNPADGKVGLRAALVLDALYRSALSGRMEAAG